MEIYPDFDLRPCNTFRAPARARYFAEADSLEGLREALAFARQRRLPTLALGEGSNLLFKSDYPGLALRVGLKGRKLLREEQEHGYVQAMGGESWHDFVRHCLRKGFYGLENLSLIPGTVGAAPVQNIGAYGVELKDSFHELEALHLPSGELATFSKAQCAFSYRNSVFQREGRDQYIICSATFRLAKRPRLNLSYRDLAEALSGVSEASLTPRRVSNAVCKIRRAKFPSLKKLGNAGSFFWNPVVSRTEYERLRRRFPDLVGFPDRDGFKLAAAWLIEQAGWKGHRRGDAGIYGKHALVLVNHGAAQGSELLALAEEIQASVKAKFGVELHPEVRII